jgi:hypothetical protein
MNKLPVICAECKYLWGGSFCGAKSWNEPHHVSQINKNHDCELFKQKKFDYKMLLMFVIGIILGYLI